MREIRVEGSQEVRDALDRDWFSFFNLNFPSITLIPLSNNLKHSIKSMKSLGINGLILSGGDSIGKTPQRDVTEKKLIQHCINDSLPILGVCRGMQMINIFFGGQLRKNIKELTGINHVVESHKIVLDKDFVKGSFGKIKVNSYHNQGMLIDDLASGLVPFANAAEKVVEGFYHKSKPIVGIQWHPERVGSNAKLDKKLFNKLFKIM